MLTLFFLCACRTQSVYAKEKITVGTNAEYAPFEYLDSDGNLTATSRGKAAWHLPVWESVCPSS